MSKNRVLYSKGEEIFNGVSHIVGGGLGLLFLIFSCIYGFLKLEFVQTIALLVYSFTIIVLYLMSTLYHMISNEKAKKIFRIFDHCSIFLLIAGTYTPYILLGVNNIAGNIILLIEWILTIVGITFNGINMNCKIVKILSYVAYIVMGWGIVIIFKDLITHVNNSSLWLLLIGGIIYTVGFIFYGIGKKKKWFHSIWHLFVLVGSILHLFSIVLLIFF